MNRQQRNRWGIVVVSIVVGASIIVGYSLWRSRHIPHLTTLHEKVPYDITIKADTLTPKQGQKVKIAVSVQLNGAPVDLLAKKIYPHISVVSEDVGDVWFYHIDEMESPAAGVYEATHLFSQATPYTIWVEINDNTTPQHHGNQSDYITTFAMKVQGAQPSPSPVATVQSVKAVNAVPTDSYTLRVLPYELHAGTPGSITVVAEGKNGKAVPLLPNFDHFYIFASPQNDSFYTLVHPQPGQKGATRAIVGPTTFPKAGRYALWIRLFPDDGSGTVTDIAEGTLVIEVK